MSGGSPPKRKRKGTRGTEGGSVANKTNGQATQGKVRVKGRRNPIKVPKWVNFVQARLNMQRKFDVAVIDQS